MTKQVLQATSAPEPLGPSSVATEANGFVFVSGQVGINPETGSAPEGGVEPQTRQAMTNLRAILSDNGLTMDDIVKTTLFLASMGDFPKVNTIYSEFFGGQPPARSTIEAGALPGGYLFEIEAIAAR